MNPHRSQNRKNTTVSTHTKITSRICDTDSWRDWILKIYDVFDIEEVSDEMEIRWTFSSRSPRRATLFNSIWKVTMTRVDRQSSHSGAATLSRARWSHMAACTCSKRARNCRNCSPRGWPLKLKKKREREREKERRK